MTASAFATRTSRAAALALLIALLTALLSACSGSGMDDEQRFAAATSQACKSQLARMTAIRSDLDRNPSKSGDEITKALSQANETWLNELRKLEPPSSTGVSGTGWKEAIDVQLRDSRALTAFDAKELPRLFRSLKTPRPTPKLPPGTGPTAAIIAQAFNSPEGRRYLRLQKNLYDQMAAHELAWTRVVKAAGLLESCRGSLTSEAQRTATSPTTTR